MNSLYRHYVIDHEYLELIVNVLSFGKTQTDRTSVGQSTQLFGNVIGFQCSQNDLTNCAPFIQSRTFTPRIAFEEWKWMMSGSTDAGVLQEKNIHIWDGNTTREFLDSRGLKDVPVNHIGKAYGYQYRNFGGIKDQISELITNLKEDPNSRRHVVSIWNPAESHEMALTPCFHLYEFSYIDGVLNLYVHGRSSDVVFGLPYNLAWSYFFLLAMCSVTGYQMGEILLTITNAHCYANQIELAKAICQESDPWEYTMPQCSFGKELNTLEDILSLEWEDVKITGWTKGPKLTEEKIEMAV
jgi:thymidylate synthase